MGDRFLSSAGTGENGALHIWVPNDSPVPDKNRAPLGPESLSSTGARVWRKAPKAFPDSSSALDNFSLRDLELFFQSFQEWPRQTKPKKGQFMNFSQGHFGTEVQCESCLFSQGKTPEFTRMGEIHELFVSALSLPGRRLKSLCFGGSFPIKIQQAPNIKNFGERGLRIPHSFMK